MLLHVSQEFADEMQFPFHQEFIPLYVNYLETGEPVIIFTMKTYGYEMSFIYLPIHPAFYKYRVQPINSEKKHSK
jgi:hypothetical protein